KRCFKAKALGKEWSQSQTKPKGLEANRKRPKNCIGSREELHGRRMLIWHQLRSNKGLSYKGRKANWFTLVEKELLKEERSREVKEEFVAGPENSCWDIRRVVRKEQETIFTEHWAVQSCEEQTERSDIVGVLLTRPHGNGKRKLDLNIGAILRWRKRREVKDDDMLKLPQRLKE
ncbi:9432_t:CDS:2, partial [Gigaspora rosea]